MKNQLTLKETRELKNLFLESNGVLTEGIVDKIKDSIKKRFTGRDTGELKQSLSDNLGIDENTSVEEIEEKLEQETGGKKDFRILTKILREILGFSSAYLIWELQALIGAGIIKYFDYNPIAIAAVVISVIFSVTENWEKIRRKGLGKKVDQFIYGKRSHLGDFDDNKKDKENDNEMNESRKKVIRLTESDLTRIVKRVIKENDRFSKDLPKNPLDLMARTLKKNDIKYNWPLNKGWLNIEDTDYRIYLNDDGTYKVQDSGAKHKEDKIRYTSPRYGLKEKQTPERNTAEGAEDVAHWLKRWG